MGSGERKNACQHIVYKTGIQGDLLELIHMKLLVRFSSLLIGVSA